ncbi:preprotein translocase subunit SecE [Buchnera aphidicola]|uniref:preprotein translocase subunit SecE n=1 Tax=Buchnera aphidicola TaxID=9 RepID=UPI0031B7F5CC
MKKKNNKKIRIFYILSFFFLEILFFLYFYIKKNFISKIIFLTFSIFLILILISKTKKIKNFLKFIQETIIETKKINCPKKKEILYISIVVILITIITSSILWIIDNLIFYIVSNIISIRL